MVQNHSRISYRRRDRGGETEEERQRWRDRGGGTEVEGQRWRDRGGGTA